MAKGPESQLWLWLKSGLPALRRPYHVRRMENSVRSGDPDVEGCIGGVQFTVELKVAHYERKSGTFALEHYTNMQAWFHHERDKAGGRTFLLIRVGDGADREHYLVHGRHALEVYERRMELTREYLRGLSITPPDAACHRLWNAVTA